MIVVIFFGSCGQYMGDTVLIAKGTLEKVQLGSVIPNSIIEVTIDGKSYDVPPGPYVDNYGNPKIDSYIYLYRKGINGWRYSAFITNEPVIEEK